MTGMYTLATAAIVSAGTGIYEAGQQHKIAGQAMGQSGTIFAEQQGFEAQLEALIKDPSSVTKLPGYQFNFDQGSKAVARQMAGSGFLGSGNEAVALTQFGQGMATSAYQTQAALLASLSGLGAQTSPTQGLQVASGANSAAGSSLNSLAATLAFLSGQKGSFGGGGTSNLVSSQYSGGYSPTPGNSVDIVSGAG